MKIKQVKSYFINKEHVPCPLTEKLVQAGYQQVCGGYIDRAKREGIIVDYMKNSPSQYWHLMTFCDSRDADKPFSKSIVCGELLLWMAEVSCVVDSAALEQLVNQIVESADLSKGNRPIYDRVKWNHAIQEICFERIQSDVESSIDDQLFVWNHPPLTKEELYVNYRPKGCPNCFNEEDGIAPIVWKEPKGKYVDVKKRNGKTDFVYNGGIEKPEIAPSWKCCLCGQEFYSKKIYPSEGNSLFCIHIDKAGGPIGRESFIRAVYNTETDELKVLFRYREKAENEVPITPEIRELFSVPKIAKYMTMKYSDINHWSSHDPYWITLLWKGRTRQDSISSHYIITNPLLRQLIRVLFEDDFYDRLSKEQLKRYI
jgi:hypothetical protein